MLTKAQVIREIEDTPAFMLTEIFKGISKNKCRQGGGFETKEQK